MKGFTIIVQKGSKQNLARTNMASQVHDLFLARAELVSRLESMICCNEFFEISEAAR